ncbi:MAG: hypothetical protein ACUVTU_08010 [Desulfurispora sp.]|uniref:hypothetical protein n=1 Tax=Desulfurispora sp. TaxID=3014275 RepID=UPI00404B417A
MVMIRKAAAPVTAGTGVWPGRPVREGVLQCQVVVDRPGRVMGRSGGAQGAARQEEHLRLGQWVRGP